TILLLQWDEPFVSASTASPPVGAASDYDLIVYNTETPVPMRFADVFARSDSFNVGGDALEAVVFRNPRAAQRGAGPARGLPGDRALQAARLRRPRRRAHEDHRLLRPRRARVGHRRRRH